MDNFWAATFGTIAVLWSIQCLRVFWGMSRLPRLAAVPPLPDQQCPKISVLFAGRDEAEKLPTALPTLLAQDYPDYEVIAVDDRSSDATPRILDEAAARDRRLKVIHVAELPAGWLGKSHGLQKAFERSAADWLVFTDADVRFAPGVLRHAISLALRDGRDHLTAMVRVDLEGFWEKAMVTFWGVGFMFALEPWQASNPHSSRYIGVGAFQLIRRTAYEAIGTHRRLAMEVVDDMKLGKLVKQGGFSSGVVLSEEWVRVRWQDGIGNIIRGLTKNSFAAMNFSYGQLIASLVALFLFDVMPFVMVVAGTGWTRLLAGACVLLALLSQGFSAAGVRVSPLYALTHPLGAFLMGYIVLRSTAVTLWRGGVVWRDTFYPIEQLRRGSV